MGRFQQGAGQRLGLAARQLGTWAGLGLPTCALDSDPQPVAAGRAPCQGRCGQSLPLSTSPSLDLLSRDDTTSFSLCVLWFIVRSSLLPTQVDLSEGRVNTQFTLVSFPDTSSIVSQASVNVVNYYTILPQTPIIHRRVRRFPVNIHVINS